MSKLGFAKQYRLVNDAQIRQTCRRGKKLTSAFAAVFFCPNSLSQPRVCASISKKQVHRAVKRNRIKRLVRESFRLTKHQLPAVDIVFVIYKAAAGLDNKQLREFIAQQWQRIYVPKSVPKVQESK